MKGKIDYHKLELHFTAPKVYSPFTNHKRIPRKMKKRMKKFMSNFPYKLELNEKIWFWLEYTNPDYKRFLIKKLCNDEEKISN